jgi:DNA polymerase III alpha subunit
MLTDKYSNPIFNERELFDFLYRGYQLTPYDTILIERTKEVDQLETQIGFKFVEPYETHTLLEDYDKACQSNWNMPDTYKTLNIEELLVNLCPAGNYQRLIEELQEFKSRDMINLLRWLKYLVDTLRTNNITWGVGRGSSVASYVLFLLGVHKIDSVKYNLDYQEFLR